MHRANMRDMMVKSFMGDLDIGLEWTGYDPQTFWMLLQSAIHKTVQYPPPHAPISVTMFIFGFGSDKV